VICQRCRKKHTREEWDSIFKLKRVKLISKRGFSAQKASHAAHHAMLNEHGLRPDAPPKPPLWLRMGAKVVGEGASMKKTWAWFSGKKTLIASILVGIPVIWEVLQGILISGGVPEGKVIAIGGSLLLVVGWAHKIMKAAGLAKEPEKK